jgi:hypothetical protein
MDSSISTVDLETTATRSVRGSVDSYKTEGSSLSDDEGEKTVDEGQEKVTGKEEPSEGGGGEKDGGVETPQADGRGMPDISIPQARRIVLDTTGAQIVQEESPAVS